MKTSICQFTVIHNSTCRPHDYGSISVVLFKSTNVNAKNFSIYLHGLRKWITKMMPTYFPGYRFLLWIDQATLEDPGFQEMLSKINRSKRIDVEQFGCPSFFESITKRHIDLFGTIIRFFPWFDFAKSFCYGRRVLTMDVEPSNEIYVQLKGMCALDKIYHQSKEGKEKPLDILYHGKSRYDHTPIFQRLRRSPLPYSLSSLIYVVKRLPQEIVFSFLNRPETENQWVYGPLKSRYSFGSDELFLNLYVIPYAVKSRYRIGVINDFTIADGFYYFRDQLLQDPRSPGYLRRFCPVDDKATTEDILDYIDRTFYFQNTFKLASFSKEEKGIISRYWKLIEELVDDQEEWMPMYYMSSILHKYKGLGQFIGLEVYIGSKLDYQMSVL